MTDRAGAFRWLGKRVFINKLLNFGMNNLEIEIRMVRIIRKALSILIIINAVSWFIGHYSRLNTFDIIYSSIMLIAGIVFLSGKMATEKILIRTNESSVFIKWVGKINGEQVFYNEIERIYLKRVEVEIARIGMKKLKYNLDGLERGQKKEVYDYFIKVAGEKNLILERRFER
jgi:hypothetical protein